MRGALAAQTAELGRLASLARPLVETLFPQEAILRRWMKLCPWRRPVLRGRFLREFSLDVIAPWSWLSPGHLALIRLWWLRVLPLGRTRRGDGNSPGLWMMPPVLSPAL